MVYSKYMEFKPSNVPDKKEDTNELGHQPQPIPIIEGKKKFEGVHDYLSQLRLSSFILKRQGPAAFFKQLQQEKLKSFKDYFESTKDNNPNLQTKLQYDLALYPGLLGDLETAIAKVNEAQTEEEAVRAFNELNAEFFTQEN